MQTCSHCGGVPSMVALITHKNPELPPETRAWCQDRFDKMMRDLPDRIITAVPVEHAGRMIAGLLEVANAEGRAVEARPGDVVHLSLTVKETGPFHMFGKTDESIRVIESKEGPSLICDPLHQVEIARGVTQIT